MKIYCRLAIMAVALFQLVACNDEKNLFDINTKLKEYQESFVQKYGPIPADQSWDFYAQSVQTAKGVQVRAAGDISIDNTIGQPADMDFSKWQTLLTSNKDNSNIGTHNYSLISPSNGKFKIFAVWYAGWYETYTKFNFEFGIDVDGDKYPVFGGRNVNTEPVADHTGKAFSDNPGFGADVNIPAGTEFCFYIHYVNNGKETTLYSNKGNSTLLYADAISSDKQIMVVGFEDNIQNPNGTWPNNPDFNDVVLYIEGNPELPIATAKRFMCEDLGKVGDFDFNDIVFDLKPQGADKATVTLQAAGGTLPAMLYVNDHELGEVHKLFGCTTTTMINTGRGETREPVVIKDIDMPTGYDFATFDNVKIVVTDNDGVSRAITCGKTGEAPSIITVPISTRWMLETIDIKSGYPTFFKNGWTELFINTDKLY